MNEQEKENNDRIYRKLLYFYEKKIPVHFCLHSPGWKNGVIKELNKKEQTMILNEMREGELNFLLEEININTIQPYKTPEELSKLKEEKKE